MDRRTDLSSLDAWIRNVTSLPYGDRQYDYDTVTRKGERVDSFLGKFRRVGTRFMISKRAVDRYQSVKTAGKAWRAQKEIEWESNGWTLFSIGDCSKPIFSFEEYAAAASPENATDTISECYFGEEREDLQRLRVAEQWLDVFGQPLIPFDLDERRRKLKRAYEELDRFIAQFRVAS